MNRRVGSDVTSHMEARSGEGDRESAPAAAPFTKTLHTTTAIWPLAIGDAARQAAY